MFNSKIKVISEDLELSKTLTYLDFISVLQAVKVIVNNSTNSNFFIIKLVYNSNIRKANIILGVLLFIAILLLLLKNI